jgi:hypothetical protein
VRSPLRSGILCCCLLSLTLAPRLGAQGGAQQPAASPSAQSTPQQTAEQPQASSPQNPPQPTAPGVDVRDTGGDGWSIEPMLWLTHREPVLLLGREATRTTVDQATGLASGGQTEPGNLNFPGRAPYAEGFVLTVPTLHENSLELSAFRLDGSGTQTESENLILFGNNYAQGDLLITTYRVQSVKLSWNYLTYPYPSRGAKFRVKTLWEVQYAGVRTVINAPNDAATIPTSGNKDVIFPTFGLGLEYHPSKTLRLELKGSGFALYHRADIWDLEASAVLKLGAFEAFAGGKAYHFKTSPQANQYFTETLLGPYVGVRWIFR